MSKKTGFQPWQANHLYEIWRDLSVKPTQYQVRYVGDGSNDIVGTFIKDTEGPTEWRTTEKTYWNYTLSMSLHRCANADQFACSLVGAYEANVKKGIHARRAPRERHLNETTSMTPDFTVKGMEKLNIQAHTLIAFMEPQLRELDADYVKSIAVLEKSVEVVYLKWGTGAAAYACIPFLDFLDQDYVDHITRKEAPIESR